MDSAKYRTLNEFCSLAFIGNESRGGVTPQLFGGFMETNFDTFRTRLMEIVGKRNLYPWAKSAGIGKNSLNGAMTRRAIPKTLILMQIATATGCSVDWLLGLSEQKMLTAFRNASPARQELLLEIAKPAQRAPDG